VANLRNFFTSVRATSIFPKQKNVASILKRCCRSELDSSQARINIAPYAWLRWRCAPCSLPVFAAFERWPLLCPHNRPSQAGRYLPRAGSERSAVLSAAADTYPMKPGGRILGPSCYSRQRASCSVESRRESTATLGGFCRGLLILESSESFYFALRGVARMGNAAFMLSMSDAMLAVSNALQRFPHSIGKLPS
jgi:hypothetical protein